MGTRFDYGKYMERALQLARNGEGAVSPNPMVGAVIVAPGGRIIGEGWHMGFGGPHAEVNACASVKEEDSPLLRESAIFVTLEPCAHHGKTPPCADLLVRTGFRKVVIATEDPFPKVDGEGIRRIREAGIEVVVGVLGEEARRMNETFFFAHTHRRPFVTLKWAQSSDGWMDSKTGHPYRFSTATSRMLVHRMRSLNDAIMTSTVTAIADNPRLDTRYWPSGRSPLPVVIGTTPLPQSLNLRRNPLLLEYQGDDIADILSNLYNAHGITSVLVEAGPTLLKEFLKRGLWNVARVEVSPIRLKGDGCVKAPGMPCQPQEFKELECNEILIYRNE